MSENQLRHRAIKSFVRREGRITQSQQHALGELLSLYGLPVEKGIIDFDVIFECKLPLVLEIGFGMGDSLITMAKNSPDINFIGIEVYRPGVGALLNQIHKNNLENVRVFFSDAVDVLTHNIPSACFNKIQIFFPDPWHKRRHHKRRLIQREFSTLVFSKLKDNGIFHIKTDCEGYACNIVNMMNTIPNVQRVSHANHCLAFPETKFEKRGKQLGHSIWDLKFLLHRPESIAGIS